MKLSVIIPFHNEFDLINRAVKSVASQSTLIDIEILIANDGPDDNQTIINSIDIELRNNVTVIVNRFSKGPGGARNSGLELCSGEFIAFLDADDFWLPGKIDAQIVVIMSGASFVPTAYRFDAGQAVVQPPSSIDKALDVFLKRGIGTSTVIITRELLADFRFKDIRFAQDIDFWYALASSPRFRYSSVNTCFVEYSTAGSTKNKWVQLLFLHKVLNINNVPFMHRIRVLLTYVVAGINNHYLKRIFNTKKQHKKDIL